MSPDGQRLASSASGRLEVLDVATRQPRFSVPLAAPGGARHLAFFPDGHRLVSINRRYEIEVRDAATDQNIMTPEGDSDRASNSTTALSPGGDWLAEANRAVALWDMLRASLSITLPETRNSVWSQAWMPQKNRLAVGTSNGELLIWDLDRVRSRLAELDLDR